MSGFKQDEAELHENDVHRGDNDPVLEETIFQALGSVDIVLVSLASKFGGEREVRRKTDTINYVLLDKLTFDGSQWALLFDIFIGRSLIVGLIVAAQLSLRLPFVYLL